MIHAVLMTQSGAVITFAELGNMTTRMGQKIKTGIMKEFAKAGLKMRNDMIREMKQSPPSGKVYGKRKHTASLPGNPPRIDTGRLVQSLFVDVRDEEVEVGSNIESPLYPIFLERGTRRMLPRPWVEPVVQHWSPLLEKSINMIVVKHMQGFKP